MTPQEAIDDLEYHYLRGLSPTRKAKALAIEALQFQQSVVRCKDCALKPYGNRCEHWSSDVSWFGKYVEDDDYCSQGIRRDEE